MKLRSILLEWTSAKITHWDEVTEHNDYDPMDVAQQAEAVTHKAGINVSYIKELAFVAYIPGSPDPDTWVSPRTGRTPPPVKVVGAVWSSIDKHEEYRDAWVYDFDLAVDPECRDGLIGIHLINAALGEFRNIKGENPNTMVRVYVINPRLAKILEKRYGFKVELRDRGGIRMTYNT